MFGVSKDLESEMIAIIEASIVDRESKVCSS